MLPYSKRQSGWADSAVYLLRVAVTNRQPGREVGMSKANGLHDLVGAGRRSWQLSDERQRWRYP
jgi:hypothetical protein